MVSSSQASNSHQPNGNGSQNTPISVFLALIDNCLELHHWEAGKDILVDKSVKMDLRTSYQASSANGASIQ